ncbi:MAG: 5-(carboxyamino)imidazole ribonucleotide synthase [Pseudomonadota bacterium]
MTKPPAVPLLPGATLGVLGGGQLGRMFSHAATRMGYHVAVLDPAPTGPAAEVSTHHICCAYDDEAGLAELADLCDAVTTEFENVPADSLRFLQSRIPVSPRPEAVEIAQSRIREKTFFVDHQIPTNHHCLVSEASDLDNAFAQMSGRAVIKTTTLGYDGKGQQVCNSAADMHHAFASFGGVECLVEDFVAFDAEVSVIIARDFNGNTSVFPVAENQHHNGILDISIVPARVSDTVKSKAEKIAHQVAQALNYVGVLAIEMFVVGDELLVNEIAPRPHNSGHYTLDATSHSQFDLQVLMMCGLPPVEISQHSPVVMLNVLGDLLLDDSFSWQPWLEDSDAHIHVYGKASARAGRKMAHVNFAGKDTDTILIRVVDDKSS